MVISTGLPAFFRAVSGQLVLFAAPAGATVAIADNPAASTIAASPEPSQRCHPRMCTPLSIPDAGPSMADGVRTPASGPDAGLIHDRSVLIPSLRRR